MPTSGRDSDFVDAVSAELPRLARIARLLTGNADVADELVAETVARSLPRWRAGDIAEPAAYLRRVLVNTASRRWRRAGLSRSRDVAALQWSAPPPEHESTIAERERTLRALRALPVRRRAVVVLRFYDDLSEARIAEVLGVQLGTVKSQLSRALEQLRAELGSLDG